MADVVVQSDQAWRIETHGVDEIYAKDRHGKPRDLFWVWLAGQLSFSGFVIGQLFTQMGLNVWESLAIAVFVGGAFLILGLASLPGPRAGTGTLMITRSVFGVKGNTLPALLSWLNMLGWESITMVLTVYALGSLISALGWNWGNGVTMTLLSLAVSVIVTFSIPILGHQTIMVMQRLLAYGLGILSIILLFVIFPHVNWSYQPPVNALWAKGLWPTMIFAGSIGLMSTVFSWTNFSADYSRYLPEDTPRSAIIKSTWLGSGVAGVFVLVAGTLLGTFVNPKAFAANPVSAIMNVLPHWYVIPFLLVVIGGQITSNYLNAYSSSLSFLAIGFRIKRYQSALIDAAISIGISVYILFFAPQFVAFFTNFLSLSIVFMGPWTAMYIVHYFLSKGHYDSESFFIHNHSGAYWFHRGYNWSALAIFFVSALVAFSTVNSTMWVSPLSKTFLDGMDLSAYTGPLVAAALYTLYWQRNRNHHVISASVPDNLVEG